MQVCKWCMLLRHPLVYVLEEGFVNILPEWLTKPVIIEYSEF